MSSIKQSALSKYFATTRSADDSFDLEWKNLNFSILVKDSAKSKFMRPAYKKQQILQNVSGKISSGQLLAIMGPTGCGKTSLLNILAARVPRGGSKNASLSGSIKLNGTKRNEEKFRSISAYVLQDDNLYAHLTVLETLQLAATFFLPADTTEEARMALVEAVIAELGLVKARDTPIGNDKSRGVSGGERKRVCVAVQLISDPAVLFLDEPTSGLDSFQALSVMQSMKDLALNGRLVISVIHQPRSAIFNMFDRLLLLSEGRAMFSGVASDAVDYFASGGFLCQEFYNPSDFFLDILSPDNRSPEQEKDSSSRIHLLGDAWAQRSVNELARGISIDDLQKQASGNDVRSVGTSGDFKKAYKNFVVLCWRAWVEQSRDVAGQLFKNFFLVFFALIIGGIYSNIGNNQLSIQNRNGFLFFVCINIAFSGLIGVLNSFPKEKNIVNRERSSRAYDTISYFTAKFVVEIPLNTIPALIYSCIVYWLVGLRPGGFGIFIGLLMFEALIAISLGLGVSAAVPTVEAANAVGPPLMIIGILFAGFYIKISSLPIVADWVPYFSLFRWTFEALCINEYTGLTFNCEGAGNTACLRTGEEVLVSLSFEAHTVSYPVFGQGMLIIGFLAVAFFTLSLSQLTFLKLGHVGAKYKSLLGDVPPTVEAEIADKQQFDDLVDHDSIPDIENTSGKSGGLENFHTQENSHNSLDVDKVVTGVQVENSNYGAESKNDAEPVGIVISANIA